MAITKDQAKKLLECYAYREFLQQQKERVMRDDTPTYEAHVRGISTGGIPSGHVFTVTRQQLIDSVTAKQVLLDIEITKLGGVA